jgi:hypothetical protein
LRGSSPPGPTNRFVLTDINTVENNDVPDEYFPRDTFFHVSSEDDYTNVAFLGYS